MTLALVDNAGNQLIVRMEEYVFGPVVSRRLGRSLGIDPIPQKTCNWNCVYCQLGRTTPLVNERAEYAPAEEIVSQTVKAVESTGSENIDWITFAGSGEPTLHTRLGWMIRQIQSSINLPIAILTNGTLLYLPEVREAIETADAVSPNLDAGSKGLFRKINRPHPEVTFDRLIEGLIAFRKEYSGKLWIETVLIKGLNDSEEALRDLAAVIERIGPDKVHLNRPTRPPSEEWVEPVDEEGLMRARAILGEVTEIVHESTESTDLSGFNNAVEAIIAIVTRHPMSQVEIERALGDKFSGDIEGVLADLETNGKIQAVVRFGSRFWRPML